MVHFDTTIMINSRPLPKRNDKRLYSMTLQNITQVRKLSSRPPYLWREDTADHTHFHRQASNSMRLSYEPHSDRQLLIDSTGTGG